MSFIIDPASPADLAALMSLTAACVARMRDQGIEQWDEVYPAAGLIADDIAARSMWVMRDGGAIIGCVTLDENLDPNWAGLDWRHTDGKIAVVHRVMVHPEHQGKGLAKKLMAFTEAHAASLGYAVVRLDAFTQNPASLAVYEKLGYTLSGTALMRKGAFVGFEKRL